MGAVLLGMVPVTVDVALRVVGQSFVFLFAPVVAYVGIFVKGLTVHELVSKTVLGIKCHDCLSLRLRVLGLQDSFFNMFAGISSPAIVSNNFENKPKEKLRKYYALNRIVVSTILFLEIAVTLALIVSARDAKVENVTSENITKNIRYKTSDHWIKSVIDGKFENVTIESMIVMPAKIRKNLSCANVCPAENVENKTVAEKWQHFIGTKNLTESTSLTNVTSLIEEMMTTQKQNGTMQYVACHTYVPIVERDFFILAVTLMILAMYTIIESLIMLLGNHTTLSDWLLFDQKDRPDKVSL